MAGALEAVVCKDVQAWFKRRPQESGETSGGGW